MKLLFRIIKRVIIVAFLLYVYNYFAINYDLLIPINYFTFMIVFSFGIFGLVGLVLFRILIL